MSRYIDAEIRDRYEFFWCENCVYFGHADMGGEGWCFILNKDTWAECYAGDCDVFVPAGQRWRENEQS